MDFCGSSQASNRIGKRAAGIDPNIRRGGAHGIPIDHVRCSIMGAESGLHRLQFGQPTLTLMEPR